MSIPCDCPYNPQAEKRHESASLPACMSRYMTIEADDEDVADQDGDGDDDDDDDDTETDDDDVDDNDEDDCDEDDRDDEDGEEVDDDDEPPSGKNPHSSEAERLHNIVKQNGQY